MTKCVLFVSSCLWLVACGPGGRNGDPGGGGGGGGGANVDAPHSHSPYQQNILMLDFRSGWWAGSAGNFHETVLAPLRDSGNSINIEFHHFTVGNDVKCLYAPNMPSSCQTLTMSSSPTPSEVVAQFEMQDWNDYTQVWILSGSDKDQSDIVVTGDLFAHFIGQAGSSCIPVFIGAGDGFITHANAMAQALTMGTIMSTSFASPGFFFGTSNVTVDSKMMAGMQLTSHELFNNVQVVADGVGNGLQHTHGDALVANPLVQVIATDSTNVPVIGIGSLALPGSINTRPFILDAGMQRYYGSTVLPDTLQLLKNIRHYLATHGCNAVIE